MRLGEKEDGKETLMQCPVVMGDGTAIRSAMLTLVSRPLYVAGRNRDRRPPFRGPARVIDIWRVVAAGDFTPNGPIQAEDG
jgi:hypothetical protein